jgi:hypothetical protein
MKKVIRGMAIVLISVVVLTACSGGISVQSGTWDGNVFTNESTGIKFTMPEEGGLRRLTESEIMDIVGAGADILVSEGAFTQREIDFGEANSVYEFYVMNDNADFVSLMYERASFGVSIDDYVNIMEENLIGMYEALGLTVRVPPSSSVTVAGEQFKKITVTIEDIVIDFFGNTITLYQDYYMRKQGNIFIGICVSYDNESTADFKNIINAFSAV